MRVFLTGHKGKIGSVLHRQLNQAGHEVVGYDIADGADILAAQAVQQAMEGCDTVAHLAMAMGDKFSPEQVYASGTTGVWNILQAAQHWGIQRVVSYSSVNAMGIFMGEAIPDFLPLDETHPCRPGRAYGIAKYLGEETCRLFTARTGISTICIRPPAVLSDADIAQARQERQKTPTSEWTPLWEYGCYIHVEDLARATISALTCPDPGHVALLVIADDLFSSTELTSHQLAQKLLPQVQWRGGPEYEQDPHKGLADTSLAKKTLNWRPQYQWRP